MFRFVCVFPVLVASSHRRFFMPRLLGTHAWVLEPPKNFVAKFAIPAPVTPASEGRWPSPTSGNLDRGWFAVGRCRLPSWEAAGNLVNGASHLLMKAEAMKSWSGGVVFFCFFLVPGPCARQKIYKNVSCTVECRRNLNQHQW